MDVIRDIRTNYKDFLARLFIDFLLLWMRFVDRIYRMKEGSSVTVKSSGERSHHKLQDTLRQRSGDRKAKSSEWTDDVNLEENSKQQETKDVKEPKEDNQLQRTGEMSWLRKVQDSSESLDEVNSSILESTDDLEREISALSDYYSDDEDLANEWETATRDRAIAGSLAIAENLERGSSKGFGEEVGSTYESFCEGLEKLRDAFRKILEEWKKRDENIIRDARGRVPIEEHRRRCAEWSRYAVDVVDLTADNLGVSDPSSLNDSLEESTSRLNESLREYKSSLERHHQLLVTHEHLMQQRNALNRRMLREYSETKELLSSLETKRIALGAKVNDQELKRLCDSCEDLYAHQLQLRDKCLRLTSNVVDRRKSIQKGAGILRDALSELDNYLRYESEILNIWRQEKVPEFRQRWKMACELKRQFDERKTVVTEKDCCSYIEALNECRHHSAAASEQFVDKWNTVSRNATDILKQKYLDFGEHEKRCFEWKDFMEMDEFGKEYERHLEAFQEYVPRICQIYERRSPGLTGIFGPKTENAEFKKFYQGYKRKIKAIEEDYLGLESLRILCCQEIENYGELYDSLLRLMRRHRQTEREFKEEESLIQMTQEKLTGFRDSIQSHLTSKQGKRLTDEKRQIIEGLNGTEKQLNESHKEFEHFEKSLTDTKKILEEIHKAQVLRRHLERMKSFAVEWEQKKSFEKTFELINYVENFQAIENPQKVKFEAHEERIEFLEKRLPKIIELHQENCTMYLQTWFDYSLEYDESNMEPVSFAELAKRNKTWSSYCTKVSRVLKDFQNDFTIKHQQLHRINEALSLLSAQPLSLSEFESVDSIRERFDGHFHRVENNCRNLKQALADFKPVFDEYSELKTGLLCFLTALAGEQYSTEKLTEKLENCRGLLRVHRDHLERRRIRMKIDKIFASMKDVLFTLAKDSESQVESLEVETGSLMHNFIEMSGRHFSVISQLRIPNVRELLIFLDNFEQALRDCEVKLDNCQETLMKEEKTVHEYCNSVQLLREVLSDSGERTKKFQDELKADSELLRASQSFIEGYSNQEKCFDTHLGDSKWRLAAFEGAFNSAEKEARELDKLFMWYCSEFGNNTSGDSFIEQCTTELIEMSTTMKDYWKRFRKAEHCIRTMDNTAQKSLVEGKRNREGIVSKLAVSSKDIIDKMESLRMCQLLLEAITTKTAERESRAVACKKRLQDENYKEQCKLYQSNPMENEDSFTCTLCSKATLPHQGIILRECLHRFCKECLETHIKDSKTAEIACPRSKGQTPCFGVILAKEIRSFGEDVNKFCEARSLSEYKDENRFVLICASCCRLIADDSQARCHKPFFLCPYCSKKNCRRCKVVHEGKETCEDYRMTLPYRKIVESLKCIICVDKYIQVAFDPCGHAVSCEDCARKLQTCPYCKTVSKKALRVYLPIN